MAGADVYEVATCMKKGRKSVTNPVLSAEIIHTWHLEAKTAVLPSSFKKCYGDGKAKMHVLNRA